MTTASFRHEPKSTKAKRGKSPAEPLTIEDLKASTGKGPSSDSMEIANTYYSDEEFLAALEARSNETSTA